VSQIEPGSKLLIITEKRKRYLVTAEPAKRFHCSEGFVEMDQLLGKEYGCVARSNTGSLWTVHRPSLADILMHFPRLTQIVYPKDLGQILVHSGLGPGGRVLEAGTGSAVLTCFLAHFVRPSGKVYSYDIRSDYIENADKRLIDLGLREYVELKLGDVTQNIDETMLDAVILDLPEPWRAVANAWQALLPSGRFLSLSPTVEQVVETVEALSNGFSDIGCVELLQRNIRARRGMTRPEFIMRGHTAYLVTARKSEKS